MHHPFLSPKTGQGRKEKDIKFPFSSQERGYRGEVPYHPPSHFTRHPSQSRKTGQGREEKDVRFPLSSQERG
jgi:hypothetical protein